MNKKKLPKAIRPAADEERQTTGGPGSKAQPRAPTRAVEPSAATVSSPAAASSPTVELVASEPATGNLASALPVLADADAERRRSQARSIIERHAAYSAVGGLVPIPIANFASITAIIVRMVKVLSDLYGVPFERDRARAIVIGLMGGAMPSGLAAVTTSTLLNVVPGSNLIGLAVSSVTAVACTRSVGRIFLDHFEGGATLHDFPSTDGR